MNVAKFESPSIYQADFLGSNSLICMLVGTILNKHAHNFAEFFHARNGTEFVGYAEVKDRVQDLGQHFRAEVITTTSIPETTFISVDDINNGEVENITQSNLLDDLHGEFQYPLTPVIATMTLLVGNTILSHYYHICLD